MIKYTVAMTDNVVATIENVHSVDIEGGVVIFRNTYGSVLFMVNEKYFASAKKVQDASEQKEVCSG